MHKRVEKIGENTRKRTENNQNVTGNIQGQSASIGSITRPGSKKKKSFASKILKYSFGSMAGLGAAAGFASTSSDAATIITSLLH